MRKRFMQLAAAVLAVCLTIPSAGAITTNRNGQVMIRVGLASSNAHVPTGELEAAHLENNDGYGAGYRFGYYDDSRNFVELARTDSSSTQVAVLKTENLYYGYSSALGKNTYSASISSNILVGCYHVQIPGSFSSYDGAKAEAAKYNNGFVAWINGAYQVRAGAYGSRADAEAAQRELGQGTIVGTSAYGMSVVATGTNRVLFQYDGGESGRLAIQPDVTGARETQTWFSGYKYRGGFQYHRRTGGNLTVVNMVELEDYVNGVICYEMGREWPLEALKTQAVCARTYVLKNLNKHNSYGFDICTTSSCQVYHGMGSQRADYGPSQVSMQAVDQTAGLVATYQGRMAEMFYSSSFGGASENASNIWGTDTASEHPYLRGVEDPYEADLNAFNDFSPWTVSYTSAQLSQRLQSYGLGTGNAIDRLELTYSELGNVIKVVVRWANGQTNTISASNIRSRLGLNSIRFTVNGAGTSGTSVPAAPSSDVYINGGAGSLDGKYTISGTGAVSQVGEESYAISGTGAVSVIGASGSGQNSGGSAAQPDQGVVTVSGNSYTFNGGGWGHQVGMSQYGANAMARRGFTFDKIVTFYFPGTQITHY
ncbi:MAG: SpoIID/LytB domain-containing protein [Lawsonibacter sp.]|nr:SpoIID/LytB domain-containing protein [Lawsonibacter sp.]